MRGLVSKAIFGLVTLVASTSVGMGVANAAPGDSISLYISAPLVQGSGVSGTGAITETFDSYSASGSGVDCPSSIAQGTFVASAAGVCKMRTVQDYGGASSTSSSPSSGGVGSRFPAVAATPGNVLLTFSDPVKYVGLWWSAGNTGNKVEFLNNGTVIAEMDSTSVVDILGASAPSPWPSGAGTLRSIGGTEYPKGKYFGNPRGYSSPDPVSPSSVNPNEPFLYLNLYITGGLEADQIRFSGGGFEFDNLTTSTLEQDPEDSMVFVAAVLGHSVEFKPNGDDVTGTMAAQIDTETGNLTANAFQRPGYRFIGWNTDEAGEGTAYEDGESYSFEEDLILFAQWEEITDEESESDPPTELPETGAPFLASWMLIAMMFLTLAGLAFRKLGKTQS